MLKQEEKLNLQFVPMDVYPLIDRNKMPQVDDKLYPDLFVFLGEQGMTFSAGIINPTLLKLHQEVDIQKAMNIPDHILGKPLLIAQNEFVLDGDHRAYRHFVNKTKAPFIRIEAEFYAAYNAIMKFPGTFEVT